MTKSEKDIESAIEDLLASEGYADKRPNEGGPNKDEPNKDRALEDGTLEGADDQAQEPLAEDVEAELERLRTERDQMRDRFMRALADAENARKRGERDRREAEQYGSSKMSRDMLPVFDNLKRALEVVTDEQRESNKALIEGIELTMRELVSVFAKHGIEAIIPEIGDRFDPKQHQAMFEAPVPGTRAGDIIQVMGNGFMLHDRLLRAAQVGVSSTPKSSAS